MKKHILIGLFVLLGISANAQLQNLDFENWTQDVDANRPDNWVIGQGFGQFGIYRDSLPQAGTFAMTLSRWYYYTFDDAVQTAAAPIKPVELKGFYRYTENDVQYNGEDVVQDTAHVYVFAKKWNSVSLQNDTIGRGHILLTKADFWTAFTCPVYYISNDMPDSVTIRLAPTERYLDRPMGMCPNTSSGYCSYFTVDNLSLSETVGLNDTKASQFSIFPNPANDRAYIATASQSKAIQYTIIDATGRTIKSQTSYSIGEAIDISRLQNGIYFLIVNTNGTTTAQKIIKQ